MWRVFSSFDPNFEIITYPIKKKTMAWHFVQRWACLGLFGPVWAHLKLIVGYLPGYLLICLPSGFTHGSAWSILNSPYNPSSLDSYDTKIEDKMKKKEKMKQRNWVPATNSDFLFSISMKPNIVDLRNFKLSILYDQII